MENRNQKVVKKDTLRAFNLHVKLARMEQTLYTV
jgi:hypothetical protein